jgi:hypothetical protein
MPTSRRLARPTREFCCRVGLVAIFVAGAYQTPWEWLRLLTSECVLRISASLGMTTSRLSFDTILVGGQATQYVIACTFVDVFMGAIPLLWNLKNSLLQNLFVNCDRWGFVRVQCGATGACTSPLLPRSAVGCG